MPPCSACPRVNICIPPSGPQRRGGLLFVGEAPGQQEDRYARRSPPGLPFIGKTGEEVDRHYLPLAGLRREEVCFDNAIRCLPDRPGGKLDPTRAQDLDLLETCANAHLPELIDRMQPRLIIPLGNFACRAVYGEAFDLEVRHGIPAESQWGPTFPMYHPAMGLHEPKKMLYVRTDWDRLRKHLRGVLLLPTDAYPDPDYAEVTHAREIQDIDPDRPLAADTESSREGPYCLTYSQWPGVGRLIRADRTDLLGALEARVAQGSGRILFHHWLYDWTVVEAMGLSFPHHRLVDTLARVYHLGNLPQGLKALAFRELGMAMQDYDDLVTPHSRMEVIRYYRLAYAEDWPKPEPQLVRGETGQWKLYRPHSLTTKLKTFFTYLQKNPDKDVFEAWDNWEAEHEAIEEVLGPWPGKDIRHVPFEEVLPYACRDADALIRLWPILKGMARLTRRFSQELWREKVA